MYICPGWGQRLRAIYIKSGGFYGELMEYETCSPTCGGISVTGVHYTASPYLSWRVENRGSGGPHLSVLLLISI